MIIRILSALLFTAAFSTPVFASGSQILLTIYLHFGAIAACIIIPGFLAKTWSDRIVIAAMVLLSSAAAMYVTNDWSVLEHLTLINILAVVFPVLGLGAALFLNSVRGKRHGAGKQA